MNLIDSSGWIEYFADEENADFFAEPPEQTGQLVVLTIARIYEALLWTQDADFEEIEDVHYIPKNGNEQAVV